MANTTTTHELALLVLLLSFCPFCRACKQGHAASAQAPKLQAALGHLLQWGQVRYTKYFFVGRVVLKEEE